MNLYFTCAEMTIKLCGEFPFFITEDVKDYLRVDAEEKYDFEYVFESVKELKNVQGIPRYYDQYRIIIEENGLETRIFTKNTFENPYAVYQEKNSNKAYIQYIEKENFVLNMQFLELVALEKCLLQKNGFILHGCFIEHEKEAIVFSAPSGTGKSTQGALWEKYENAKIINGDRCAIQMREDGVYACGIPFCGSSTINENKCLPLKAIVILEQAPKDKIKYYSDSEYIKKLLSEATINYWNSNFVEKEISLIEQIVLKEMVIGLECTISKKAVEVLKQAIEKNEKRGKM